MQVEEARLKTWWYLILALGPNRRALFTQVRVPLPFPLLPFLWDKGCPVIQDGLWLFHCTNYIGTIFLSCPGLTPPSITQVCIPFLLLCLGLDPKLDTSQLASLIAESGVAIDVQSPSKSRSNSGGVSAKGRLFAMVISANMSQFPVSTPTLRMLLTGCHAIMQFTGNQESVEGSLIQLGECR